MNPNDQPREPEQPNGTTPESGFNPSPQPDTQNTFNSPAADFSSNAEPVAPLGAAPTQSVPESQSFASPAPVGQPVFPSPEVQPVGQAPAAYQGENPGQTLGIVSIVLSVVGFSLIGLILGIVSRNKSKAVGAPTTLGTIGMIIGIVLTVLSILITLLIFIPAILLAANSDVDTKSNGSDLFSTSQSADSPNLADDASTVAKKAEAYKVKAGDYPEYSSDFDKYPESAIDSDMTLYTMLVSNQNVTYLYCEPGAAQVVYYTDDTGTKMDITPLGTASSTESCVEIN